MKKIIADVINRYFPRLFRLRPLVEFLQCYIFSLATKYIQSLGCCKCFQYFLYFTESLSHLNSKDYSVISVFYFYELPSTFRQILSSLTTKRKLFLFFILWILRRIFRLSVWNAELANKKGSMKKIEQLKWQFLSEFLYHYLHYLQFD